VFLGLPETSHFLGPNQLPIETEVHPFRDYALQGSGVHVVCVGAVCSGGSIGRCGGCIGNVGANRGGPVHAVSAWVWVIDRHQRKPGDINVNT